MRRQREKVVSYLRDGNNDSPYGIGIKSALLAYLEGWNKETSMFFLSLQVVSLPMRDGNLYNLICVSPVLAYLRDGNMRSISA